MIDAMVLRGFAARTQQSYVEAIYRMAMVAANGMLARHQLQCAAPSTI